MIGGSAFVLAVCLAACGESAAPIPDAGIPPHECGSAAIAAGNEVCKLPLGEKRQSYIATLETVDWWVLDVPEPLPARALLTVTARYEAASTPVVLSLNVLLADGLTSVAHATDPRRASSTSAGAPGPAQAVAKLGAAGRYFVVVRHDASADDPAMDRKNPYSITARLESDPDSNEPNDATSAATAIPLAACGTTAQATGALSTSGDVDRFGFDVTPCNGGRTLLHVSVEGPASPAAQIRLKYSLSGPAGVVSDGNAPSPMTAQSVRTVRLAAAGHYELAVSAYKSPHDPGDPPGDTAFVYTVKVALYPDLDTNEGAAGNDGPGTATQTTLGAGGAQALVGRLSYVGDADTYLVRAPASPTRLHYRLTWRKDPGQFLALPTLSQKHLVLFDTLKQSECNNAKCPGDASMVAAWCAICSGPATDRRCECLRHRRVEDAKISDFKNFEGQLYLPPGSGDWYLQVGYHGGEGGADDLTYDLDLELLPGTEPYTQANPRVVNLGDEAPVLIGWSHGTAGTATAENGLARLPRSQQDYDSQRAREWLEFRFTPNPTGTPDPAVDQALRLKWTIDPAAGQQPGQRSYDVGLHFVFFGSGTPATQGVPSDNLNAFWGYSAQQTHPWYHGKNIGGPTTVQADFETFDKGTGVFQANDAHCICIDKAFAAAGRFQVAVEAFNRTSYADSTARLQFAASPYPAHVLDDSGAAFDCPVPCGWVAAH